MSGQKPAGINILILPGSEAQRGRNLRRVTRLAKERAKLHHRLPGAPTSGFLCQKWPPVWRDELLAPPSVPINVQLPLPSFHPADSAAPGTGILNLFSASLPQTGPSA